MGFTSVYGFIHGNVNKLLSPIDGNGNFCGMKNGKTSAGDLTDYPNLYIGNLEEAVAKAGFAGMDSAFGTAVCVKKCPEHRTGNSELVVECKSGTNSVQTVRDNIHLKTL